MIGVEMQVSGQLVVKLILKELRVLFGSEVLIKITVD
jgi:hypothetical protein